ncbi:phage holin family protein [Peptoniphilus sp. GNH]|nr:phage holin family protein [Peptoniphilus sp. GNH]
MSASNIFYVVLSIVSVLITGVLVPLLKQKYGREKILTVMEAVDIAVKAAEQIYKEAGQGNLKKQYVLERLNEKGFKVTEKDLDDMRKASVLELNKWKDEIKKPGE